jgi:hypothetical protein
LGQRGRLSRTFVFHKIQRYVRSNTGVPVLTRKRACFFCGLLFAGLFAGLFIVCGTRLGIVCGIVCGLVYYLLCAAGRAFTISIAVDGKMSKRTQIFNNHRANAQQLLDKKTHSKHRKGSGTRPRTQSPVGRRARRTRGYEQPPGGPEPRRTKGQEDQRPG